MSTTSPQLDDTDDAELAGRYEFRAWCALDAAFDLLGRLADSAHEEQLEDWYLRTGRPDCNAKIRGQRLKIKRLLGEEDGFQRWASTRCRILGDGIDPFDVVTRELGLIALPARPDRAQGQASPVPGLDTIRVRKWRRCFELGNVKAEAVEMAIDGRGRRLTSVAIEGEVLEDLVEVRTLLGLDDCPNIAVHLTIDDI